MKKYLVLLLLLLLMANPACAQGYSTDLSCGFNQCLSKYTGLTALSENIAESKIKAVLQEHFSGMFEVHTGNEWKKVAVKAGAGLAAIVCGRSFEKRTYCAEIVRFMYAKEKEGMD